MNKNAKTKVLNILAENLRLRMFLGCSQFLGIFQTERSYKQGSNKKKSVHCGQNDMQRFLLTYVYKKIFEGVYSRHQKTVQ